MSEAPSASCPTPIRVMYVDDEPSLVMLAQRKLSSLGYDVTALVSSREALQLFQSDPKRFDIIVSDITMPELSGDQFARMVHRLRRDIPIVLITGFDHTISAADAQRLNVIGFLNKPFRMEDLDERIRGMLVRN